MPRAKKNASYDLFRFNIDYLRLNMSDDFPAVFFDSLFYGLSETSPEAFYNIFGFEVHCRYRSI